MTGQVVAQMSINASANLFNLFNILQTLDKLELHIMIDQLHRLHFL